MLTKAMPQTDLTTYWQEIASGGRLLSRNDMEHCCDCAQCQGEFLKVLNFYHLKITPEIMAAITADDFKQQVVRALCLRAVAAGVGN